MINSWKAFLNFFFQIICLGNFQKIERLVKQHFNLNEIPYEKRSCDFRAKNKDIELNRLFEVQEKKV